MTKLVPEIVFHYYFVCETKEKSKLVTIQATNMEKKLILET